MKQRLQAQQVDWLVVDSYCATARYLAELNRIVPVFYVDDFRKEHYEVSALLQIYTVQGETEDAGGAA